MPQTKIEFYDSARAQATAKMAEINSSLSAMRVPSVVSDEFDAYLKMAEMFMKHGHVVVTITIEGVDYEVIRISRIERRDAAVAVYMGFDGKEKKHPILRWQHFGFFYKGGRV